MASIPRIVAVDPTYEVARIMRGALALLNRHHVLTEVPTPEHALEEVTTSSIDLVVTTYHVSDDMNGIELATRIAHESLGTHVIVLADERDPLLDKSTLSEAPFQYFMRPVGEEFLRGLRIALDGEAAVVQETQTAASGPDLGPVPNINVSELRELVGPLMRDVGAMGIILADRTGRIMIDEGATGYIDRERLAVIMGPLFAQAAQVSPLVGGKAWSMVYYDGERLDVFGLALGVHYFMGLIFEGSNRGAFGAVNHFGRRAVDQMIDMIGDAAYLIREPEPLRVPEIVVPKVVRPAKAPAPVVAEAPRKPEPALADLEALFEAEAAAPALQPLESFDPDTLFGQAVDENLADSMFDPEALSRLAASLATENDERVGYDEAFDMGILDDLS